MGLGRGVRQPALGGVLRELRRQERLSQVEVARRLGITQSAVSQYEHGRNLSPYKVAVICRALGVATKDVYARLRAAEGAENKS